jgi:hypothetical protein
MSLVASFGKTIFKNEVAGRDYGACVGDGGAVGGDCRRGARSGRLILSADGNGRSEDYSNYSEKDWELEQGCAESQIAHESYIVSSRLIVDFSLAGRVDVARVREGARATRDLLL